MTQRCDSVHISMQHCNDEKLFIRAKKNIPESSPIYHEGQFAQLIAKQHILTSSVGMEQIFVSSGFQEKPPQ